MRTSLTIEQDVHEVVMTLSHSAGKTAGQVLSELARAGLKRQRLARADGNTLPRFQVGAKAVPIAIAAIRRAREEEA